MPYSGIRWVKPETIHITLKFCGEIPEEMARAVSSLLDKELPRGPFELAARGVGGFPKLSAPRVVWTGITGDTEKLCALARAADNLAARRGVAKERKKFSPHITLGRRSETTPLPADVLRELTFDEIAHLRRNLPAFMDGARSHIHAQRAHAERPDIHSSQNLRTVNIVKTASRLL